MRALDDTIPVRGTACANRNEPQQLHVCPGSGLAGSGKPPRTSKHIQDYKSRRKEYVGSGEACAWMQPIHEQGTQERFPAGIAEDAEEINGACGQEVSETNTIAPEQRALFSEQLVLCAEAMKQSVTSTTELSRVVLELSCTDIDFHTLAQQMEGLFAKHNAEFQALTQSIENLRDAFANLKDAASPLILEQFVDILTTHLKISEVATTLFEAVQIQRRRLITLPNSVCHSECSSFSDSSLHDGFSESSSDVSAPDSTSCPSLTVLL